MWIYIVFRKLFFIFSVLGGGLGFGGFFLFVKDADNMG